MDIKFVSMKDGGTWKLANIKWIHMDNPVMQLNIIWSSFYYLFIFNTVSFRTDKWINLQFNLF